MTIAELNPKNHPMTPEVEANLAHLCDVINELEKLSGIEPVVTSGLRSYEDQLKINPGAPHSRHLTGEAVDLYDPDSRWYVWLCNNLEEMIRIGIWCESKNFTRTWMHVQTAPPASGKRFFFP